VRTPDLLARPRPPLQPGPPSPALLRQAVAAVFVLDGAVFGSWASRVPDVADRVGAGHSTLGIALLCLSLGALACMQVTGALCARFGAGRVTAVAALLLCLSTVLPGLATSVPQLCAALVVFGGATGMVNVAANAVGVEVEALVGRPILSGLHAGFSFGGLGGALLGGLLAGAVGVTPHLALVAAGGVLVTVWAGSALVATQGPRTVPHPVPDGEEPRRPTAVLVVLGAIAGCTAFGEGALSDWGALHLRTELGASAALAAAGYAGFSLAMACGRLAGGRLVDLFGERRLLAAGTVLAAAGGLTSVTATSVPTAVAGFVVVGLGLANVFPLAIARAGALGGASGIALATTVGYTGLLGGPPAIGLVAEHLGLPVALGMVPLLALVAAVLVLSLAGDAVRFPAPPTAVVRALRGGAGGLRDTAGPRLQPLVSGFGHATAVYVRDLDALLPLGGPPR
jgi:MFS family permease